MPVSDGFSHCALLDNSARVLRLPLGALIESGEAWCGNPGGALALSQLMPACLACKEALLPVIDIHGISAAVMDRVLDFVYTDNFARGLGGEWLTPAGAEHLFGAADMLLLFSMKVNAANPAGPGVVLEV